MDITCRKGDTFQLILNVKDSAGSNIDFSLYTDIKLQVRPHDEDTATPIIDMGLSAWDTATVGQVTGTHSAADMSAVEAGVYVYDLEFTDANGIVATWFYGIFKINDDVTI